MCFYKLVCFPLRDVIRLGFQRQTKVKPKIDLKARRRASSQDLRCRARAKVMVWALKKKTVGQRSSHKKCVKPKVFEQLETKFGIKVLLTIEPRIRVLELVSLLPTKQMEFFTFLACSKQFLGGILSKRSINNWGNLARFALSKNHYMVGVKVEGG